MNTAYLLLLCSVLLVSAQNQITGPVANFVSIVFLCPDYTANTYGPFYAPVYNNFTFTYAIGSASYTTKGYLNTVNGVSEGSTYIVMKNSKGDHKFYLFVKKNVYTSYCYDSEMLCFYNATTLITTQQINNVDSTFSVVPSLVLSMPKLTLCEL